MRDDRAKVAAFLLLLSAALWTGACGEGPKANRFRPRSGWGTAESIGTDLRDIFLRQATLAMDPKGHE